MVSGTGGQLNSTRSPTRWAVGSPSVTTRTTGSASRWWARKRRASISPCCRLVPCSVSTDSSARVSGRSTCAVEEKPMIWMASCGKRVVTSECSAIAVDLAAPHVPRSAIE